MTRSSIIQSTYVSKFFGECLKSKWGFFCKRIDHKRPVQSYLAIVALMPIMIIKRTKLAETESIAIIIAFKISTSEFAIWNVIINWHGVCMGLSFYVNCYFQSDSLKSNSLTSEVEDGCHKVVLGLKMIS